MYKRQEGDKVEKGKLIAKWDPFNAVIVTETPGKIQFEDVVEGVTYRVEADETTGLREMIIIESKDRTKVPSAHILDENGELIRTYNFPIGGHLAIEDNQIVKAGDVLVKIPRAVGKAGDITGGLPRVTELFEARNPSNPAVVSEIDGEITMGKLKRGNREIIVTSKLGEVKKYMVPLSKQLLVQENDYIRAGMPLSDGAITPSDILAIKGPTAVQEYIVNEVQDVYRLQGVKINDKHFEVIVRQMMRKVRIEDAGDTKLLDGSMTNVLKFEAANEEIDRRNAAGETNEMGEPLRKAQATQLLMGITKASLATDSFLSAASFQETTKVLTEAAIMGKKDHLVGLKENVLIGKLIPAGTGLQAYRTFAEELVPAETVQELSLIHI